MLPNKNSDPYIKSSNRKCLGSIFIPNQNILRPIINNIEVNTIIKNLLIIETSLSIRHGHKQISPITAQNPKSTVADTIMPSTKLTLLFLIQSHISPKQKQHAPKIAHSISFSKIIVIIPFFLTTINLKGFHSCFHINLLLLC